MAQRSQLRHGTRSIDSRGAFRIFEKKVYKGGRNLGAIKGDETTLVVRGGGILNGRI
jgi:hypothetical protein